MLLYRCAEALMYILVFICGVLFAAGRETPHCMAAAMLMILICMLLYWAQKRLWVLANQQKPAVCVEATLVNHRQEFSGARLSTYNNFFLTFETNDGKQIEFKVSRDEFDRIQLGAKGLLEYRGGLYLSFRKPSNETEKHFANRCNK